MLWDFLCRLFFLLLPFPFLPFPSMAGDTASPALCGFGVGGCCGSGWVLVLVFSLKHVPNLCFEYVDGAKCLGGLR